MDKINNFSKNSEENINTNDKDGENSDLNGASCLENLFDLVPDGTRIIISGNRVTFENLTPDMAEIAEKLRN